MARRTARKSQGSDVYRTRHRPHGEVETFYGVPVHETPRSFPHKSYIIIPKMHPTKRSARNWIHGAGGGAEYFHIIRGKQKGFWVVDIDPKRNTQGRHKRGYQKPKLGRRPYR